VKFTDNNGWEGWGDFTPSDVHKQYGIALKTPKYRDGNVKEKTKVSLTLFKPSDESESEPQDFFYIPHESTPFPVITSGHNLKQNYNSYNNDMKIKQEGADQNWAQARMSGGYTTTQITQVDTMLNIQPATTTYNNGYMQQPGAQQTYQMPNIPNVPNGHGYTNIPGHISQMSPYNCQQPSPDSQSFANLNIESPQQKQEQYQEDIEHLSGKLENFNIGDHLSLSEVIDLQNTLDMQQGMHAPVQEPRRGKRSQQTAALESGSNVVPRELARMGSEQLNTPNCSDQINNTNMSEFLKNCKQINDL